MSTSTVNRSVNRTASQLMITISPAVHWLTLDKFPLIDLPPRLFSSDDKYAYVYETGKDGTHPHLHIYVEPSTPKRPDTYKRTIFKRLEKVNVFHPFFTPFPETCGLPFLDIKKVSTYEGCIQYMSKENNPVFVNLTPPDRPANSEWTQLGSSLIPLTYRTFEPCYRKFLDDTTFSSDYDPTSVQYYDELQQAMYDYGFDRSFLIRCDKFCMKMIAAHHGNAMKYFAKSLDQISEF